MNEKEGWDWSNKKYHYFVEGRSLCRNWGFPNYTDMQPDTGNTESQRDDCKACFKGLIKRRQKLNVSKIVVQDISQGEKQMNTPKTYPNGITSQEANEYKQALAQGKQYTQQKT